MKKNNMYDNQRQRGAVSLFVVVFTALLVTIITVGFVGLMVRNQEQATQSDLSQSAYDSALAGVEDAKRVLLLDKQCREGSASMTQEKCDSIASKLANGGCKTVNSILGDDTGVTLLGQTEGERSLQQAYTCAKITLDTPDYQGTDLSNGQSQLVALKAPPNTPYNTVKISWFTQKDAATASPNGDVGDMVLSIPRSQDGTVLPTPKDNNWPASQPSLLRAQLIQTGGSFALSDFNNAGGTGASDSNSLFLYPSATKDPTLTGFDDDTTAATKAPLWVECSKDEFDKGGYACSVELTLPDPINGTASDRIAYLRLTAFYNTTRYRVELMNSGTSVPFYGVQPEVDVTGRANDVFRRVKARVQLDAAFPYPESSVDLNGNLCKDFAVTNDITMYSTINVAPRCDPRAAN